MPEVVIIGNDGTEHRFPSGFDPKRAAAIVRRQSETWADRAGLNEPTDSRVRGFLRGSGAAAADMVEGAASGLMSTAFHGGDLIRRSLGMERVIDSPEAQQAMRAPASVAGTIGRVVEQGAEFAIPLSKVSKSVSALSWLSRMAAEGAAGAGAAGIQSGGDPTTMTAGALAPVVGSVALKGARGATNAIRNMAAGAAEDGVGGAIAGVTRAAAPVEPKTALVQALKPRNTRVNFGAGLDRAFPEIKASEQAIGRPIASLDDLLPAVKNAKQRVWSQYEQLAGPQRAIGARLDLSGVADAIDASIPKRLDMMKPKRAAALRQMADAYRNGTFGLDDAETLLREANADLDAYYNKFPGARRSTALTNPETANTVAEAEALRKAIYRKLDATGEGQAAAELKRRYGALLEVEDAALRRSNVAARQQPESLSEQIGKVRAAADMARGAWRVAHGDLSGAADIAAARAGTATAKYLKEQQTTDALIRRAFASFRGEPVPIPMPAQPTVAGLLPPATTRLGGGADRSSVRAVPAEYAKREPLPPSRQLPPGARPMPAAPDPSSVRAVRGEYGAQVPKPAPKLLPSPARQMPTGADPSGVRSVEAGRGVQRDSRTGRMRRVYLSTPK